MKILAGSSNLALAESISQHLKLPLSPVEITQFPNGEKRIWVKEKMKGENVVLIQSFCDPTDQNIMEFLLLSDALERLGALSIDLILPWMGYSLQDKVFREGEPIAAKVVANLVSAAYIRRAYLLDLHNSSTPGFFSIPTQHLSAMELFVEHVKQQFNTQLSEVVVASPDFGGLKRARAFAEKLGVPLAKIDKNRDVTTGEIETLGLNGTVKDKHVVIFDDVINGGGTVVSAARFLKEHGAKTVHFCATHGPLVANAYEKLVASQADSIVVTNTIAHSHQNKKMKILDVAPLFAKEIKSWWKAEN